MLKLEKIDKDQTVELININKLNRFDIQTMFHILDEAIEQEFDYTLDLTEVRYVVFELFVSVESLIIITDKGKVSDIKCCRSTDGDILFSYVFMNEYGVERLTFVVS